MSIREALKASGDPPFAVLELIITDAHLVACAVGRDACRRAVWAHGYGLADALALTTAVVRIHCFAVLLRMPKLGDGRHDTVSAIFSLPLTQEGREPPATIRSSVLTIYRFRLGSRRLA
jgi:hypothetical protein